MGGIRQAAVAAFIAVTATCGAAAQDSFPSRAMTIIVPFPAGTGGDAAVRVLANELSQITKRPVVIENRPGVNGIIAAQVAMRAAPDGYTVFMGVNSTHAANPSLYKELPYSPLGDFAPVTLAERAGSVFVVSASSPRKSMADLTRDALAKPGSLNVGVANATTQVSAALYRKLSKADFTMVPYQGAPALTLDVTSGRLDFAVNDVINTMSLRKSGDMLALAVTSPFRISSLPDVPTMAELGYPGFSVTSWGAYFVPIATPRETVLRLNSLIHAAYRTPAVRDLAEKIGNRIELTSPEELKAFVESEIILWRDLVRDAGLEPK